MTAASAVSPVSTSRIIAWKYANAFVPDAEMSAGAKRLFPFGSASSVDWLRQRMGGLWVGGAVTLTDDGLYFRPNAVNVAAHAADTSWALNLDRVVSIEDRFGWLTRIVDIRSEDGTTLTFRCFGAAAFAKQIRDQVAARKRDAS
jgi:hypothetical protein